MHRQVLGLAVSIALFATPSLADTSECTEITSVPTTISTAGGGVFCFRRDFATGLASGSAITIAVDDVTIDMNGFRLGNLGAGPATLASGIRADGRNNITIRNGTIRGFFRGIQLTGTTGSGHRIEDVRADSNLAIGLDVQGDNMIVRNNHIVGTGNGSNAVTAAGISVIGATNPVISGNVVSGLSETDTIYGIYLNSVSIGEISENKVFDVNSADGKYGIYVLDSTNIAVMNNRIVNR